MEPVSLAVIGTGMMGRKHAELIAANPSCSLVGVCDIDPSRSTIAKDLDVRFYSVVEELLDRERPHGVIISTPNDNHSAVIEACVRLSVSVLVEKPLTDNIESARRIVQLADDTGTPILVGYHRRHSPFIQKARSIIMNGALGNLVAVSMLWALLKPDAYYEVAWRRNRPGGGPTLINLVHEIDSLRFICGEIDRVYAQASSTTRKLDVEDSLSISLSFANGGIGSILASDTAPSPWSYEATTHENPLYFESPENCYLFFGTLGSLSFPSMELWRYTDENTRGWQHPLVNTLHNVTRADPLKLQLEHFCRVINRTEEPIVNAREGARSLSVALAVLESMGRQIPITPETF